ncbi:MAG: shikimate kinase [Oligoflexia bacterium]|nr:shikimate kinase [Oligoflexia bacterium]
MGIGIIDNICKNDKADKIALIGFMGSGKSTLGALLAKRLNFNLVDTDARIVTSAKQSISEIFKIHGEAYFRTLESNCLHEQKRIKKIVLACGGGLPCNPQNRELLKLCFLVVWINAPFDVCCKRILRLGVNDTSRPLAMLDNVEIFEKLYNERSKIYQEIANYTINISNQETPCAVAGEILNVLHPYISDIPK